MFRHHILLILYPAQGHIHPAFQFAKKLVSLGAHVTVSTTLHMHRRITNKPTLPGLSFLPFSDGFDHGYTFGADHSLYTSEFTRRGTEFVTNLLHSNSQQDRPFTCLVYTSILSWAADVAREYHLPTALLWTQPATILDIFYFYFHGYGGYIDEKIKDSRGCIELPGLPLIEQRDLPSFLLRLNPTTDSGFVAMFEKQILALDKEKKARILVNTFEELEPEALRVVDKFNMIPIGPFIPSALLDGRDVTDTSFGGDIFQRENGYVQWLNSKEKRSVVYVSFGSFCVLSKKQMEELARALLDCGSPFLLVIREKEKKSRVDGKIVEEEEEEEEISCREELEKKGKIVKWCSQVEVLSHGSVGCFVTHCGWNSSMESLASGVPMVAFPQWVDQKTNAKLIEDVWKAGVRVDTRKNKEGIVEGDDIRECLELVMGSGDKGIELRKNAEKWKSLAREAAKEGGSSDKNVMTFLDSVRT